MDAPPLIRQWRVKPPPSHAQGDLFQVREDAPLTSPGSSRSLYGQTVERAVCGLLELTAIPGSGDYDVVFDAWGNGTFCEIKSLNQSSSLPLYRWRREKDRQSGAPLVYLIALHKCAKCKTLGEVWSRMAETMGVVLVIPGRVLDKLTETSNAYQIRQTTKDGVSVGYARRGYCEGYYLIPASRLMKLEFSREVVRGAQVGGHTFSSRVLLHPRLPKSWLEI